MDSVPIFVGAYIVGFVFILGAEAVAIIRRVDYATFSEWAQRTFVAIYILGAVCGHIVLAPKQPWVFTWDAGFAVLLIGAAVSWGFGRAFKLNTDPREDVNAYRWARSGIFAFGILFGAVCWPLP